MKGSLVIIKLGRDNEAAVNTLIKLTWLFNYLKLRLREAVEKVHLTCSEKENEILSFDIDQCLFEENFSWLRSPQESRLPSSKLINLISSLVSETDQNWGQCPGPEIKTEKTMLNEKLIGQNYFSASSWWATASQQEPVSQVRSENFFNSPHWGNSMYFNEKPTGSAVGVILYFIRNEF